MNRMPTRSLPRYALALSGALLWGVIEVVALWRSRLAQR